VVREKGVNGVFIVLRGSRIKFISRYRWRKVGVCCYLLLKVTLPTRIYTLYIEDCSLGRQAKAG
jgi:hypothetical protein